MREWKHAETTKSLSHQTALTTAPLYGVPIDEKWLNMVILILSRKHHNHIPYAFNCMIAALERAQHSGHFDGRRDNHSTQIQKILHSSTDLYLKASASAFPPGLQITKLPTASSKAASLMCTYIEFVVKCRQCGRTIRTFRSGWDFCKDRPRCIYEPSGTKTELAMCGSCQNQYAADPTTSGLLETLPHVVH